jgi:hypothetical protein
MHFPENDAPRYLLHDRDSVFADVATAIAGMNSAAVRTAPRSPWQIQNSRPYYPFVQHFGVALNYCRYPAISKVPSAYGND